jgi:hypothetical protein
MGGSVKRDRLRRVEQKFLFPAGYAGVIHTWLDHAYLPDPLYPTSVVSSIYFDTPELFHYGESRNGEFRRTKIRLRWYNDQADACGGGSQSAAGAGNGVTCYLEVKTKQGALSEKSRSTITVPARVLLERPISNEGLSELTVKAFDLGYRAAGTLVPILMVRYRRRRYLDLRSDLAVAADTEIRCTRANQTVVQCVPPVYLDVGVLEVKGMNRGIGGMLDPIGSYLSKSPFSKYAITLEHLLQPLGRRV